MDAKPKSGPGLEKGTKDVIRTTRGNERNMWAKPLGQRAERLDPPVYDPSGA